MKTLVDIGSCKECPWYYPYFPESEDGICRNGGSAKCVDFASSPIFPDFCPIQNDPFVWVQLPKDDVLADYLEERGFPFAAARLRT